LRGSPAVAQCLVTRLFEAASEYTLRNKRAFASTAAACRSQKAKRNPSAGYLADMPLGLRGHL
jgi:hypothetical protein